MRIFVTGRPRVFRLYLICTRLIVRAQAAEIGLELAVAFGPRRVMRLRHFHG